MDLLIVVNINVMWIVFVIWRVKFVVLIVVKEICGLLIVCFGEVICCFFYVIYLVKLILLKVFNVIWVLVIVIIYWWNIKLIFLDNINDFEFMILIFILYVYLVMFNSRNWYVDFVVIEDIIDCSKWFYLFI